MIESPLLILFSITIALILIVLLVLVVIVRQSRKVVHHADDQMGIIRVDNYAELPGSIPDNIFMRLSFADSFDSIKFEQACHESAISNLSRQLASSAGDGVTIAVNSVQLVSSGTELTFSLSKNGQALLNAGKAVYGTHAATGKALPTLVDATTKKFIETAKGSVGATTLTRLATASALTVSVAHLIAGADIAKRLRQVESKLDSLIRYRRIDQVSKLERIFTSAKELACSRLSQEKCWELWRLRGELRELRCIWRHELNHHLSQIKDPKQASWLESMFTSQQSAGKSVDGQVTQGQLFVNSMEYSLRLDHVLAVVGGTVKEFKMSLSDELFQLKELAQTLNSKVEYIRQVDPNLEVHPTLAQMNRIVDGFSQLIPEKADSAEPTCRLTQET